LFLLPVKSLRSGNLLISKPYICFYKELKDFSVFSIDLAVSQGG